MKFYVRNKSELAHNFDIPGEDSDANLLDNITHRPENTWPRMTENDQSIFLWKYLGQIQGFTYILPKSEKTKQGEKKSK